VDCRRFGSCATIQTEAPIDKPEWFEPMHGDGWIGTLGFYASGNGGYFVLRIIAAGGAGYPPLVNDATTRGGGMNADGSASNARWTQRFSCSPCNACRDWVGPYEASKKN
jgi:hypothetical protein